MERPDVTMMILVHNAFRRDVDRMRAAAGRPDQLPALRAMWRTFNAYLTIHHTAEDEILWPTIQAQLGGPSILLADMANEHALLDPVLAQITDLLAHGPLDTVRRHLDTLSAVLTAHLDHEESAALPLIQEMLTPRQWDAFGDNQRSRIGIRGAAWFFPWLLDGATPEQAAGALTLLPPPLRPVHRRIWKPRYDSRMRALSPDSS